MKNRLSFTISSYSEKEVIHHTILHDYETAHQDMCTQYLLSPLQPVTYSGSLKYIMIVPYSILIREVESLILTLAWSYKQRIT
jgi:hypothetical protein